MSGHLSVSVFLSCLPVQCLPSKEIIGFLVDWKKIGQNSLKPQKSVVFIWIWPNIGFEPGQYIPVNLLGRLKMFRDSGTRTKDKMNKKFTGLSGRRGFWSLWSWDAVAIFMKRLDGGELWGCWLTWAKKNSCSAGGDRERRSTKNYLSRWQALYHFFISWGIV